MKTIYYLKKSVITLIVLITFFIMSSCNHYKGRYIYTTPTGKYVTIYDDYIIFEKYEKRNYPQDNYIRIKGYYKEGISLFFSKNNIISISRDQCNPIEFCFNQPEYKVKVYDFRSKNYAQECSFADSLAIAEYTFLDERSHFWPTFKEVVGDSIYMRTYKVDRRFIMKSFHDYKDFVVSRYTERCGIIYNIYK